jgi:hypothetical protein
MYFNFLKSDKQIEESTGEDDNDSSKESFEPAKINNKKTAKRKKKIRKRNE